jgi:WD40 repeat protein
MRLLTQLLVMSAVASYGYGYQPVTEGRENKAPPDDKRTAQPLELDTLLKQHHIIATSISTSCPNFLVLLDDEGVVYVWDCEQSNLQSRFQPQLQMPIAHLCISPNGSLFAVGNSTTIIFYESGTWKEKKRFSPSFPGLIGAVTFSPDGRFAGISGDRGMLVYDLMTFNVDLRLVIPGYSHSIAFSHSGSAVIVGCGKSLCLVDREKKEIVWTIEKHRSTVYTVTFLPGDRYFIGGSEDDTITIWDIKQRALVNHFQAHRKGVHFLAIINNDIVVSLGGDQALRSWDLSSGKLVQVKTISTELPYLAGYSSSLSCVVLIGKRSQLIPTAEVVPKQHPTP